jgi:hypothetical protein
MLEALGLGADLIGSLTARNVSEKHSISIFRVDE